MGVSIKKTVKTVIDLMARYGFIVDTVRGDFRVRIYVRDASPINNKFGNLELRVTTECYDGKELLPEDCVQGALRAKLENLLRAAREETNRVRRNARRRRRYRMRRG